MDEAGRLARGIAVEFRRRMVGEYAPRIRRCIGMLTEDQCWTRRAPNCNSVGNLLLHLRGNMTQWILGGVRGDQDRRDRPAEFAAEGPIAGISAIELADRLAATCAECADVVDRLTPAELLEERLFQGRYRETVLAAVLHVMEHCAGHAGQIYAFTKETTGADLRFYDL